MANHKRYASLITLLFFCCAAPAYCSDVYSWEDSSGYHIVDDLGKVPKKYRGKYLEQSTAGIKKQDQNQNNPTSKQTVSVGDENYFTNLCKQHIYLQLKAPATASFSAKHRLKTNWYKGKYVVGFDVDAQNSYGALIRTSFTCLINVDTRTIDELITL